MSNAEYAADLEGLGLDGIIAEVFNRSGAHANCGGGHCKAWAEPPETFTADFIGAMGLDSGTGFFLALGLQHHDPELAERVRLKYEADTETVGLTTGSVTKLEGLAKDFDAALRRYE